MDIYDFIEECKDQGLSASEALIAFYAEQEERERAFMEAYENDPIVQEGWRQQDMIDLRRFER